LYFSCGDHERKVRKYFAVIDKARRGMPWHFVIPDDAVLRDAAFKKALSSTLDRGPEAFFGKCTQAVSVSLTRATLVANADDAAFVKAILTAVVREVFNDCRGRRDQCSLTQCMLFMLPHTTSHGRLLVEAAVNEFHVQDSIWKMLAPVPPLAGKDELLVPYVPYVRKVVAAARKAEHTRITVSEPIRTILADYEDAHPALVKEVKEAADRRTAESNEIPVKTFPAILHSVQSKRYTREVFGAMKRCPIISEEGYSPSLLRNNPYIPLYEMVNAEATPATATRGRQRNLRRHQTCRRRTLR
jgi:hypothetical protein